MSLATWNSGNIWVDMPKWAESFFEDRACTPERLKKRELCPAVNISEDEKGYVLEVAAPGMERETFNIQIDRGVLIVEALSGKMKVKSGGKYTRQEFDQHAFCRSFLLPNDVRSEAISAKYENGLLRIWLPKKKTDSTDVKKAIAIH